MRAIGTLLFCACAAAPTQTVQVAAKLPDAGPAIDASVPDAPLEAASAKRIATTPWCNETYDVTPCVFRAYGQCFVRDKDPPSADDGYAYGSCPADPAPAFTSKPLACGRRANEPIVPAQMRMATPDAARCKAIDTKWANVLHEERSCKSDGDCKSVDAGCFHAALNAKAAALPKYAEVPCANPGAGMCPQYTGTVRCENGCCVLSTPSPFGSLESAYPKIRAP